MTIQQMLLGGGGESTYNLTRSLRFRRSASAWLSRTPATATNRRTFTWSGWVKRGQLGVGQVVFNSGAYVQFGQFTSVGFDAADTMSVVSGLWAFSTDFTLVTGSVFRDPSAWYHIVLQVDTTQATASNRIRLYVNNVLQTFATGSQPSQNYDTAINANGIVHGIGAPNGSGSILDGYLAENNFIDGQALTPSAFGSTNALTGVWQPARYTGTYGTNGFYLPFTNNSTAAALGTDFSGNSNTWTVNNISITAGVTYDSMTDVPTLTSATASNYAVLNRLSAYVASTLSEGNLKLSAAGSEIWYPAASTIQIPTTGKYYCEVTLGASDSGLMRQFIGIVTDTFPISTATGIGNSPQGWAYFANDGGIYNNAAVIVTLSTATTNDVIGVAFSADAGTLQFYKNGSAMGSPITGFTSKYYFAFSCFGAATGFMNFGQRPFAYTPPTGFVALNTFNLPASTIVKGNTVMDATLYTGNGSTQTITNAAGFQPDLVWVKSRSSALEHKESNAVRGATKATKPNSTDPETTDTNGITAFNSNGFSLGSDSNYNTNAATYASWQWKGGNGTVSNTNGSITSTVSVNASAGFSILTFNGTGANATVGHGLGVTPSMFIVKNLTNAAGNWAMGHVGLTSFSGDAIYLNSTAAAFSAGTFWNSTAPTSSVINLGSSPQVNESAQPIMAQVWAAIAGYSSFGTYTGNGSTDGTFVYTGFRPKVVWIKNRGGANGWRQYDTTRSPANLTNLYLQSSSSAAEQTSGASIDILSNGFKIRDSDAGVNGSGSVYIYACWAENPFRNSLAR